MRVAQARNHLLTQLGQERDFLWGLATPAELFLEEVAKAAGTKYCKRTGPKGAYKYFYMKNGHCGGSESSSSGDISHDKILGKDTFELGAITSDGNGNKFEVLGAYGDNFHLKMHTKAGEHTLTLSWEDYQSILVDGHRKAFERHASKGLASRMEVLQSAKEVGSAPHIKRAQAEVDRWKSEHADYLSTDEDSAMLQEANRLDSEKDEDSATPEKDGPDVRVGMSFDEIYNSPGALEEIAQRKDGWRILYTARGGDAEVMDTFAAMHSKELQETWDKYGLVLHPHVNQDLKDGSTKLGKDSYALNRPMYDRINSELESLGEAFDVREAVSSLGLTFSIHPDYSGENDHQVNGTYFPGQRHLQVTDLLEKSGTKERPTFVHELIHAMDHKLGRTGLSEGKGESQLPKSLTGTYKKAGEKWRNDYHKQPHEEIARLFEQVSSIGFADTANKHFDTSKNSVPEAIREGYWHPNLIAKNLEDISKLGEELGLKFKPEFLANVRQNAEAMTSHYTSKRKKQEGARKAKKEPSFVGKVFRKLGLDRSAKALLLHAIRDELLTEKAPQLRWLTNKTTKGRFPVDKNGNIVKRERPARSRKDDSAANDEKTVVSEEQIAEINQALEKSFKQHTGEVMQKIGDLLQSPAKKLAELAGGSSYEHIKDPVDRMDKIVADAKGKVDEISSRLNFILLPVGQKIALSLAGSLVAGAGAVGVQAIAAGVTAALAGKALVFLFKLAVKAKVAASANIGGAFKEIGEALAKDTKLESKDFSKNALETRVAETLESFGKSAKALLLSAIRQEMEVFA